MMNIFKQLMVSLYSPKDMATFYKQGIGKTILYVFLLVLISVVPSTYYFNTAMAEGIQTIKETIENDFPSFTIENGELISEETEPITIHKGNITFIFDSSGTLTKTAVSSSDHTLAFLKNEWVYAAAGQSQSMPYSMLGVPSLTDKDVSEILMTMDGMFPLMIAIIDFFIYLFSAAMKFIEISILAFIGLLLQQALQHRLEYRHVWRLSAYAFTLPTIFFTIMDSLKTTVPAGFLIHWSVAFLVLVLTLKEIRNQDASW